MTSELGPAHVPAALGPSVIPCRQSLGVQLHQFTLARFFPRFLTSLREPNIILQSIFSGYQQI